ncbi:preprotein translocase subunit SecA [Aporhodopirellula aestuarii]|uniref:Preprotein translocase subunit SecA n=1 Tax=Aporhodopirellula aestuarii TaxID=2950107 RepID=A0ABT0UB11_9BACT|nr:preprotein translocase subunit SecA [Aporhodopirellula aestuarii]MCM2374202.1 preprotein translocase subunit SecA [Aporhodopirellula aestuarii]
MGLFDFLFGGSNSSKLQTPPDLIWMTEAGKLNGILAAVNEKGQGDAVAILVVSHFDETHAKIERLLTNYSGQVPAMAVRTNDLSPRIATGSQFNEASRVECIVTEHHPLAEEDDRVINEFVQDLPCQCRVSFCTSLDDAVMQLFAGDYMKSVMKRMGMSDNEAIESALVSRRIRAAQESVAQKTVSSHRANSAKEWIEMNVRKDGG